METTIYIPTKLTPEVLEGLEAGVYFCIYKNGTLGAHSKTMLKASWIKKDVAYIVLPKKLTSDMVEKEVEEDIKITYPEQSYNFKYGYIEGFEACYNWLLNLNKEEEK